MCRARNGELFINKKQVLARCKEPFDGVDIDLPSHEEIEGTLKYLKNNKNATADSIAAELLKNGPNLVDALHKVIQQACTRDTTKKLDR
jgi:hypothetical protein